ncbi:hypothetical protein BS47DRAFT_1362397 [Hydnum rufescens UP504]|uniref:Uncharacterized protein n=1 Tax=Hydnum rufescens UP504 TaxID=1448309 RepID=A0A9P6AX17_9AGAM|nr:hypothetical protein BS47DRAFT_1362397 [Hydnum rufescens UP504]
MALRKKHKCAQNLGAYSQRRVRDIFMISDTFSNLTAIEFQNLNLAQPPTPPLPYLPPLYHIDQFWSTPAIQNILDDVDLVHMAPTTEDMFKTCLFDAQKTLEKLSNVSSHISGHRVKYSGATLNGKHAIWTQYLDQRKKKNLDHQIEEMKRKTAYDHKKWDGTDSEEGLNSPDRTTCSIHPFISAPKREDAAVAAAQLEKVMQPPRNKGAGHKDPGLDFPSQMQYEQMLMVLCTYGTKATAFIDKKGWIEASQWVLAAWNRGDSYTSCLQKWCCTYMLDLTMLPRNIYGTWKSSILLTDEDLRDEIQTHLCGIRPYIAAMDIVQFLSTPEMKITGFALWATIGRRNGKASTPTATSVRMSHDIARKWDDEGNEEVPALPPEKWTIVWFHDESIFYAHDHCKVCWVHNSESAKPYAKGDGASLMVADFVSADYGWLQGDDSDACITLKPGKNCDGYFSNEEVLQQATWAMDVLCQKYPNERHVFVFDNTRTHAKRTEDALSALHMPYDHPMHPGKFKGMAQILKEHGHLNVNSLYNFINVLCLLMTHCQARGFDVLFLLKFHCVGLCQAGILRSTTVFKD